MFSPIAPLFASECWSKFRCVPNRIDTKENIKWSKDVLEQNWPTVDKNLEDIFVIKVSLKKFYFLNHRITKTVDNKAKIFTCLCILDKQFENYSTTN